MPVQSPAVGCAAPAVGYTTVEKARSRPRPVVVRQLKTYDLTEVRGPTYRLAPNGVRSQSDG